MAAPDQQASVRKLEERTKQVIESRFPFQKEEYEIDIENIHFEHPASDTEAQDYAFAAGHSLETKVRGTIVIKKDGKEIDLSTKSGASQGQNSFRNIIITKLPYPSERGTYIINGNELNFLNQMNLRPGIYVHPMKAVNGTGLLESEIRTKNKRFKISLDTGNSKLKIINLDMDYDTTAKKVDALSFLKVIGATDDEIKKAIGDKGFYESIVQNNKPQTLQAIYEATHSGKYPGNEKAKESIEFFLKERIIFDDKAKKVSKAMVGSSFESFDKAAFLATLTQMFKELKKPGSTAPVDDLRFKEISSSEDIVVRGVEKGMREWMKRINFSIKNGKLDKTKVRPVEYVYGGVKSMYNSTLAENVVSPNPLDLFQQRQKVTMMGEGGLSGRSAKEVNRNLQDTAFAKIDPVETAQSFSMGLVQHLSRDAHIKDGSIHSDFYRVNNGVVDKSRVIGDMDPLDEFDEYIAFNNPAVMTKENGSLKFKGDKVKARHQGKFIDVSPSQITFIDKLPTSHLSFATNLIPFGAHNDGSRMLMGASMQKQSMSLEDPDAPLVQNISNEDTGDTLESEVAEQASFLLRSPVSGKVKKIADDFIEIEEEDGNVTQVKKLNYFTTGKSGGYINHKPVVKVGDSVGVDSLLADGWQSKNGQLALGKNTLVGYMPYEGYNFEDGVVVSESFAQKMASEEIKTLSYDFPKTDDNLLLNGPDVMKALKDLNISDGILSKLDSDGVIKKDVIISDGDIFVGIVEKKDPMELTKTEITIRQLITPNLKNGKIIPLPSDNFKNRSKMVEGYQKGKVVDVKKIDRGKDFRVTIKLLAFKPMETGDKLSGRHGNKGTITTIIPDEHMPRTAEGRPLELIFSPLAVPSRKNLGQLLEVNAGMVAEKKGLPVYKVNNFDPSAREKLMKEMEEVGIPDGKQILINPETGKPYENPITVGPMYIMKLKHKVENKITERNTQGALDKVTQMPKKVSGSIDGDRRNPQSVGGMEFWSLTSKGAVENIHELTTLKSDGAGQRDARMKIFDAIQRGEKIPEPVTPETLKVLSDKMIAAGLQVTPMQGNTKLKSLDEDFTSLLLRPLDKKLANQLMPDSQTIKKSKTIDSLNGNYDKKGLYSEDIFGKDGDKWGKIKLVEPMPNPLFLSVSSGAKPYEAMLSTKGISNNTLVDVVEKGKYIVLNPGDTGVKKYSLLSPEDYEDYTLEDDEFEGATGSAALVQLLKDVDIRTEFEDVSTKLKAATKLEDRSRLQGSYRTLAAALDNNLKPEDYLLDFVPVLPVKYREPVKTTDGSITDDGITRLYQNIMKKNEEYEKNVVRKEKDQRFDLDIDPLVNAKQQADAYKLLKQTIGVGTPYVDPRTKLEFKGIMHTLGSKKGFLRDKMQSKAVDFSGRSVIVVDPNLGMDEVSLPEDMAAVIFEPHVNRQLEKDRYSYSQIKSFKKNRTMEYRRALEKAVADQPVILNRQPSLHSHSLQAFYPKIRWNGDGKGKTERAIGLNPMVTTGFNADFDGDTMAVHVPITPGAIAEAKEKLMPSQNLYNPTNGSLIMELKHEMQLGIYYMTRDRMPTGVPKKFENAIELRKAYDKGEVTTYDSVQMDVPFKGMVISTAGKHLFNSCLPPAFQDYEKNENLGKGELDKLLNRIIQDPKAGPMKAVQTMNQLQKLSFKASTMSGISIGVKDFDPISSVDKKKVFDEANKSPEVKAKADSLVSDFIDKREAFEIAKTNYVQDQLKGMAKTVFDKDNPVQIMQASGARGNAGQITSMAGIVGVGKDVTNSATRPVNSSLLEGLAPNEFWDMSFDSRKGIFDRSVATQRPGALTRQIWMSNKQTLITEEDCGDTNGITLSLKGDQKHKRMLRGRVLLKDVPLKGGGVVAATKMPITNKEYDLILTKAQDVERIQVRSPLTCKSNTGVCQLCYGAKAGAMQNELVPIGDPIGSIAAQALGEPSQQAIMKTFHTGAGGSNVSGAFDRIEQVLTMPKQFANETVLATADGVVTNIIKDPIQGTTVVVGKKKYKLGKRLKADGIEIGVSVQIGDSLTDEGTTYKNPRTVFELQGPDAARDYLMDSVNDAFKMGDIDDTDKRHLEVTVSNMLDRATIDNGGTSLMAPGQVVPLKTVREQNTAAGKTVTVKMDFLNKMNVVGAEAATDITDMKSPKVIIVRKGEIITDAAWEKIKPQRSFIKVKAKPVTYTQAMQGVSRDNQMINQNWLDNASYQSATQMISRGAGMFMEDQLDNPLTRQMTGLKGNFAEGFGKWKANMKENFKDFF